MATTDAQRRANLKWKENNPDKYKEYRKKWRDEHPELVKAQKARWRERQKEKINIEADVCTDEWEKEEATGSSIISRED